MDPKTGEIKALSTATNKPGTYNMVHTYKSADGKVLTTKLQLILAGPKPKASSSTCKLVKTGFPVKIKLDVIKHKYFLIANDEELKTNQCRAGSKPVDEKDCQTAAKALGHVELSNKTISNPKIRPGCTIIGQEFEQNGSVRFNALLSAPGSGMRRRRICEYVGKIPESYVVAERITITNDQSDNKLRMVTNVREQCAGDKIEVEFTPTTGADFIKVDTEYMSRIIVEPTATTKPGKYEIKVTRTSTDGKAETEKMEVNIEAGALPPCPINAADFPMSVKAGESSSSVVITHPKDAKIAVTSVKT